jgi:hypothetical protein
MRIISVNLLKIVDVHGYDGLLLHYDVSGELPNPSIM